MFTLGPEGIHTIVIMLAGSSIIRKGSHGALKVTIMFEGVMEGGFRAIIKDTIMMVNKKIRNASIRGRRTALHISKTMMQVNGHGSQVIAVQLRTSVTTRVTSVSSSSLGLRWRSR